MFRKPLLTVLVLIVVLSPGWTRAEIHMTLDEPFSGFSSNDVGDIVCMVLPAGDTIIWVGTARGISKTSDGGATWNFYDLRNGLNQNIISALAVSGTALWAATAYNKEVQGELYPYGRGFNRTQDLGETWDSFIPWQVSRYAGMVCYDMAVDDTTVWAAAWYGGLIRSQDSGENWKNVFVDSTAQEDFEEEHFNDLRNYFFAVLVDTACPVEKRLKNSINDIAYDGKLIWVATQNGLQTSADRGDSWFGFDTSSGLNSNGVYCLGGDTSGFWVGLYEQEETHPLPLIPSLTGADLNSTNDNGGTWNLSSPDMGQASSFEKFAWDIAVADTVVWAACGKGGLIRSFDQGQTWENVFVDAAAQRRFEEDDLLGKDVFISMAIDTFSVDTTVIWAGTEDGLYRFTDSPGPAATAGWIEGPEASYGFSNIVIPNTDECVKFGGYVCLPIMLDNNTTPLGGFELGVEFDYTLMTFVRAEPGEAIEGFEKFTYRVLPCPQCGPGRYRILMYGQYDLPNGVENIGDPIPMTPEGEYRCLVELCFVVNNDENLGGLRIPVCWRWEGTIDSETGCLVEDWSCSENTFSSWTGDTIYTSTLCCQFVAELCQDLSESVDGKLIYQYGVCGQNCGRIEVCSLITRERKLPFKSVLSVGIQEYDQTKIIWASACSEGLEVSSCSTYKSTDDGETWTSHLGGFRVRDFAFQDSTVWAATGQGLKRTTDGGINWDTFEIIDSTSGETIIPSQFTSVCVVPGILDTIVFVGSVDGLARSKDDGVTWEVTKFAHSFKKAVWAGTAAGILKFIFNYRDVPDTVLHYWHPTDNITGNWVVALAIQEYDGEKIIWAGTQRAYSGGYGASYSTDDGDSWNTTLVGDEVWNFAFEDTIVWSATSAGLKRSDDWGENWEIFNYMEDQDPISQATIWSTEFTSVTIIDGEVWAGNVDGLVKGSYDGQTWGWDVIRTAVPETYAYPSPFSPILRERVRIHYRPQEDGPVTVKIYDFAMNLVVTLADGKDVLGGAWYDEFWDGRNEKGDVVANGVYFFKVQAPGGQTEWGKLVILK